MIVSRAHTRTRTRTCVYINIYTYIIWYVNIVTMTVIIVALYKMHPSLSQAYFQRGASSSNWDSISIRLQHCFTVYIYVYCSWLESCTFLRAVVYPLIYRFFTCNRCKILLHLAINSTRNIVILQKHCRVVPYWTYNTSYNVYTFLGTSRRPQRSQPIDIYLFSPNKSWVQ